MTRRSARDEPRDVAARVVAVRQRLTGELRRPITAPCGGLTQCARWRSRAATWASLMTPSAYAAEV
jgi:hypothetical protein